MCKGAGKHEVTNPGEQEALCIGLLSWEYVPISHHRWKVQSLYSWVLCPLGWMVQGAKDSRHWSWGHHCPGPGHFMTTATLVSVPCSIFWQGWDRVVDHSPMPFWFVPLHQRASFLRAGCPSCFLGTHKAPSFRDPKTLSSQPCCLPKAHCLSASLQGVTIPEARQWNELGGKIRSRKSTV